jgi:hypothetical protein
VVVGGQGGHGFSPAVRAAAETGLQPLRLAIRLSLLLASRADDVPKMTFPKKRVL